MFGLTPEAIKDLRPPMHCRIESVAAYRMKNKTIDMLKGLQSEIIRNCLDFGEVTQYDIECLAACVDGIEQCRRISQIEYCPHCWHGITQTDTTCCNCGENIHQLT